MDSTLRRRDVSRSTYETTLKGCLPMNLSTTDRRVTTTAEGERRQRWRPQLVFNAHSGRFARRRFALRLSLSERVVHHRSGDALWTMSSSKPSRRARARGVVTKTKTPLLENPKATLGTTSVEPARATFNAPALEAERVCRHRAAARRARRAPKRAAGAQQHELSKQVRAGSLTAARPPATLVAGRWVGSAGSAGGALVDSSHSKSAMR